MTIRNFLNTGWEKIATGEKYFIVKKTTDKSYWYEIGYDTSNSELQLLKAVPVSKTGASRETLFLGKCESMEEVEKMMNIHETEKL